MVGLAAPGCSTAKPGTTVAAHMVSTDPPADAGNPQRPPSPGNPPLPGQARRRPVPPPPPASERKTDDPGVPEGRFPRTPSDEPGDQIARSPAAATSPTELATNRPGSRGRKARRRAEEGAGAELAGAEATGTVAPPAGALATTVVRRPLRYRVLPRSAIGISVAILAFALGASLSGVVLYSYYEYRLAKNEEKVSKVTSQIPNTVKKAQEQLKAQEAEAQALINEQIKPLKSVLATGETLQNLVAKTAPALYFVHTLDEAGQPSVGTAFAVASDSRQTLLLTSFSVVRAATRKPGPDVFVRHGSNEQKINVFTWQEDKDLALIILNTGNQPKLDFTSGAPKPGERVFALSGLGGQGASITQGFVADVSAEGIQHDARTGTQFQGGPLLNSDGKVVGILSRTFSPLGFPVADVLFAVPPKAACEKVLQCPNGTPASTNGAGGSQ